jgi:uncharacterized protein YlxW (UPF0749 family)
MLLGQPPLTETLMLYQKPQTNINTPIKRNKKMTILKQLRCIRKRKRNLNCQKKRISKKLKGIQNQSKSKLLNKNLKKLLSKK